MWISLFSVTIKFLNYSTDIICSHAKSSKDKTPFNDNNDHVTRTIIAVPWGNGTLASSTHAIGNPTVQKTTDKISVLSNKNSDLLRSNFFNK